MIVKAAIDHLLVYSEPGEANGGGGSTHLGVDSPSRMDSPDSFSNALLFKDAVEIVAEDEGGDGQASRVEYLWCACVRLN